MNTVVWVILLAVAAGHHVTAAQEGGSAPEMSEDIRLMRERLVSLSRGEGSLAELRIQLMDGNRASHRSMLLEGGELVIKKWTAPGSPMVERKGIVTEARVSALLRQLIAKRYWTFHGTRFVIDAPTFLFRFYYPGLEHVAFYCDHEELDASPARAEIRELFLDFVASTKTRPVEP